MTVRGAEYLDDLNGDSNRSDCAPISACLPIPSEPSTVSASAPIPAEESTLLADLPASNLSACTPFRADVIASSASGPIPNFGQLTPATLRVDDSAESNRT
jgi:hypothetical protein